MDCYILTEGGNEIGLGHIARCSILYELLTEKGFLVEFVIRGDRSIRKAIEGKRYKIADWLDINYLEKLLTKDSLCIVDSYLAGLDIYEFISKRCKKAVYIDDNLRLDYPRGAVLCPTIYGEEMYYNTVAGMKLFLGSGYILLRKEFQHMYEKNISRHISEILITFGGADGQNLTPRVLEAVNIVYPKSIKNVVVGSGFKNVKEIRKFADSNTRMYFHINAEEMKGLMLRSDICISAAGQTLYELAKLSVPTIAVCVADNQRRNIDKFNQLNVMKTMVEFDEETLEKYLIDISEYQTRLDMSDQLKKLKIGEDIPRIIDWLGDKDDL